MKDNKIPVRFLKEEGNQILAVFVTTPYYKNGDLETVLCYSKLDKEEGCSKSHWSSLSSASYPEYRDLLVEICSLGYDPLVLEDKSSSKNKRFRRD